MVNVPHHVGQDVHPLPSMRGHPDGPGAVAFHRLAAADPAEPGSSLPQDLLRLVRQSWPRDLDVGGEAVPGLMDFEPDEEFVQYWSCQTGRVVY